MPYTLITIVLLVALFGACAACAVLYRRLRAARLLASDLSGPLSETADFLAHGLSLFSAGDLRHHAVSSSINAVTPEGAALNDKLLACLKDFNAITDLPSGRICFTGANSYKEGVVAAQEIVRILGGRGRVACVIPSYSQVNHVMRMKGCLDYLAEKHPDVVSVGVFEGDGQRDQTGKVVRKMLAERDVDLIFGTDGHTPLAVAEAIAESRRKVKYVAFDAMPENIDLLRKGQISCLIEQNSYAQAWNALVHLYNAIAAAWRPVSPKLFMEPIAIRPENYRTYWDDAKESRIMMDEERDQLAHPMPNRTGKKFRLGLIMPLSNGFFEGLGKGAAAAGKLLEEYGVSVEVIDVFDDWSNFGSVSLFGPVIERFTRERFDGFATVVVDPAIVREINKAVSAGLRVTTFNTEPLSFREIVMSIMDNIGVLSRESQDLAAASEQSSRANSQIGAAINAIRDDIREEKDRIDATDRELMNLTGRIGNVRESIGLYSAQVSKMTGASVDGSRSMESTLAETQQLKGVVDSIGTELAKFRDSLGKITQFTEVIEALAESTNVLAINASIQAARAGSAGKAFAVVAGEIRSLAGNSSRTAEDIRGLVAQIIASMNRVVEISGQGSGLMTENLGKMESAKESFESIAAVIHGANESIGAIQDAVEGIVAAGGGVKENMDAIERMSDASVNRLEDISSSVSQLLENSASISRTANRLSAMTISQETVFAQISVRE